jgi:dihydroorotate dehydrogenase
MSLLPYALARPFLFGLDPETAHELTLASLARLQRTPLQWAYCNGFVEDSIELAGLRFPNRVGLAAGLDKNARCIDALGAMGFGFVEVGTVTPKGQPGNPKPRMFRLTQANALINRLGFNNDGLEAFIANVQRSSFRSRGRLLGLNIGKNAATPWPASTRTPTTSPSTSPAPTPGTCALCKATRRWTACCPPWRSAAPSSRSSMAGACRCS